MLNVPNLDDQRFEDTLSAAVARIPYLFPEWTDFNEHDPGITLLELFCWYKQMQQYHLNCITERNLEAMYKLLGVTRGSITPSSVILSVDTSADHGYLPKGSRLISDAGVPFELSQAAVVCSSFSVKELVSLRADGAYDVTDLIKSDGAAFSIFGTSLLNYHDSFLIGVKSNEDINTLTLWIAVADKMEVKRNPFKIGCKDPRKIVYYAYTDNGETELEVLMDETHSLSVSGKLVLRAPVAVSETDAGCGLERLRWIRLSLEDAGCEEMPVVSSIFAAFTAAEQKVTLSEVNAFTAGPGRFNADIFSRLSLEGNANSFIRDAKGWRMTEFEASTVHENGVSKRRFTVRIPNDIADDGEDNLRIVCFEPSFGPHMTASLHGIPGERIQLPSEDGKPWPGGILVMCRETLPDGSDRFTDCEYTDALFKAGPRDTAFTVDERSEELVFGDGNCGAIPEGGSDCVYIAGMAYTYGSDGSATTNTMMYCQPEDELSLLGQVLLFLPGRDRRTMDQMRDDLRYKLLHSVKAVTAEDHEAIALATPGIRIAHARALPMFDPNNKRRGMNSKANVTIVVMPASKEKFPRPDERFLEAVQQQMDRFRTICTCMHTMGPAYSGITVWAELAVRGNEKRTEAEVKRALEEYFDYASGNNRLGKNVNKNDISAAIGSCRSVMGVLNLEFRAAGSGCKKNEQGDIIVPPYTIAYLIDLEIHATQA